MKLKMRRLLALAAMSAVMAAGGAVPRPVPRAVQMGRIDAGIERYGIVHWGLNTYTDREWGYGDEDPAMLNPAKFDADQIVGACKAGGLQGLIIVAKHHDGFCLWPTKTTEHNITKAPFWKSWSPKLELEKGKIPLSNSNSKLELKRETGRDYVKEMEQACRRAGLKFGVYVSPWDRNNAAYGTEKYVTDVFQAQIRELLSGDYGEIFEMWFDGANGGDGYYGGAREKRKIPPGYYRYGTETFAMVRQLQPNVCIFNEMDEADFRFGGNEQGLVDPDSRSTGGHYDGIWDNYKAWANTGIVGGSTFHPIEADFPLRPGWFYHEKERGQTKGAAYLMKLYLSSVGNAATMNVGIAPNRDGRLDDEDVKALKGFGDLLKLFFSREAKDGEPFNVVVLREDVSRGERVDDWKLAVDGRVVLSGKSIGIKRIRTLGSPVAGKVELEVSSTSGEKPGAVAVARYFVEPELLKTVLSATTESGETDTAKWMTAAASQPDAAPSAWERAEARARELCAQMTLEEKAGELMVYDYGCLGDDAWGAYTNLVNRNEIGAMMRVLSASETRRMQEYKLAHSRLKIPLIVHEDITHGWVTTLPLQIAMACSWDDAAVEKGEAVAAREAAAIGINLTYSPQVEVSDDPRWGRIGATLGEDPYLSGRMAAARVRGDQGRTEAELADGEHVVSCVKHFIGYSSLQGGKDYRHQDFSRRELLETHLPPHKAAIDAGALAVMNTYTAFDGVPCNFSTYLLTDLLRDELGFKGQLITDWTTLQFSIDEGAAMDLADAAKRGLEAGVDMDMISRAFLELPKLVREGKVEERLLDQAVVRSLALKFRMGLFDDPYRYCDEEKAKKELFSERNRRDVLELTRESIVLLKNEGGLLPLSTNRVVGLTGTWIDDEDILRGGMGKDIFGGGEDVDFAGEGRCSVDTLKVAMLRKWGGNLDARQIDMKKIARGEATLPGDDVVVLAIGEPTGYTGERRGRARITLPESELENLRALKRGGKKIVSVVFAGRPFIMNEIAWLSDAVVLAWYPGAMGGEALAEILAGEVNPSGKLAQHIPFDAGQIPLSYREKRTFISCGYADIPAKPLFPFGYGLSYTTFAYGRPEVVQPVFDIGETVEVSVKVTNTGKVAGREVVQLYLRDEVASVLPRERELREFTSVWLAPGETKTVTFALPPEAFALYDADLKRVVEPGDFTVFVGPDSTTTNAVRLTLNAWGQGK